MKAGWICAALMVLLIAGCATAGRYAGVPGGSGMYVWQENGQRVGEVRFWPGGDVTADFGRIQREGGAWSWGGDGTLQIKPGGIGAQSMTFTMDPDTYEFSQASGGSAHLVPNSPV